MLKKILKKIISKKKEKVLIPCIEGHFLDNRCALITGGGSGIGYAIAESFLKNGATVIIVGRDKDKLENAKGKLIESTKCEESDIKTGVIDISDIANIDKNLKQVILESHKSIDIFVNNAGVNGGNTFPETSEKEYDNILDINLKGMYFMSQSIIKYMIKNKIQGNILNVTSSSALRPAISPYIISKWGERGLTLGMAKKYYKYGIIVNGIAPGSTATPMLGVHDTENIYCNYTLTKRYITPEEVGNIATILVSDMGKMIIGDTIYITGGAGVITYDDMVY